MQSEWAGNGSTDFDWLRPLTSAAVQQCDEGRRAAEQRPQHAVPPLSTVHTLSALHCPHHCQTHSLRGSLSGPTCQCPHSAAHAMATLCSHSATARLRSRDVPGTAPLVGSRSPPPSCRCPHDANACSQQRSAVTSATHSRGSSTLHQRTGALSLSRPQRDVITATSDGVRERRSLLAPVRCPAVSPIPSPNSAVSAMPRPSPQ